MTEAKTRNLLAIAALADDRVGLVEGFTATLADSGCNIENSRMTVLGGQFAIIALVAGNWNQVAKLETQLDDLARRLQLAIHVRRCDERAVTAGSVPYRIEVVSIDQPGILHNLARFLSKRRINIEDMKTGSYAAPHTGTQMVAVELTVGVPPGTHFSQLRDDFLDYCDDLNLDAVIEPLRA